MDCKHPGPIENGRVIVMNQTTTYNSAVEYHCVPHYERIGPYLRKCMEDGTWSGEEPRCESKYHQQKLTYTLQTSASQMCKLPIQISLWNVHSVMVLIANTARIRTGLLLLLLHQPFQIRRTETSFRYYDTESFHHFRGLPNLPFSFKLIF